MAGARCGSVGASMTWSSDVSLSRGQSRHHGGVPMAHWMKLLDNWVKRGKHMPQGRGWRLVSPGKTGFKATLKQVFRTHGGDRLAIYTVRELPKKPKSSTRGRRPTLN